MDKNPDSKDVPEIINAIGYDIDSDYYLAEIFSDNQEVFLSTEQGITNYIYSLRNIESDHYKDRSTSPCYRKFTSD